MAQVSVSLPSDGDTIEVADYNTPINTIITDYNGNIDNSNIASGAAIAGSKLADGGITNAKLSTATGELGGAWQSFTPTFTNLTVGNGTLTGKYQQIGKTVRYRITLVFGSTTSVSGLITHSLPVTSVSYSGSLPTIGRAAILDLGTAVFDAMPIWLTTTTVGIRALNAAGTYVNAVATSSTIPMTWTTGDELMVFGEYEAA